MTTYTRTLDGVTDFTDIWGGTVEWGDDSWIPWFNTNEPISGETLTATFNLTGSDWTIVALHVWAEDGDTITLTDLDAGTGRQIDYLVLGFDSDVELISTSVNHIQGMGGADRHDIVLGSAFTDSVSLDADINTLTVRTGGVGRIWTGGRDTILIRSGGADLVETGDLDDKVTVRNGGSVQSLDTGRGKDVVVFNGAYAQDVLLGGGSDSFTVKNGASAGRVAADDGNDTVLVEGGSLIFNLYLGDGDTTATAVGDGIMESVRVQGGSATISNEDGWIGSILAFDAELDITTGKGGGSGAVNSISTYNSTVDLHVGANSGVAQALFATADSGRHTVVADGWIASLLVGDNGLDMIANGGVGSLLLGDKRDVVKIGAGGADFISTQGGNDTVRIGAGGAQVVRTGGNDDVVKTGKGYVELINTGAGDDTVTLGSGVVGHVRLGDGNDHIAVVETDPRYGDILWGDEGTDTIDFSAFAVAVTVDLSNLGAQEIGATPVGRFQLMGFENLTATDLGDTITADDQANTLRGLAGNDRLLGGGGADRLFGGNGRDVLKAGTGADILLGGRGNDRLTGGGGADIFEFAANAGIDHVVDFEDGTDLIRIADHAGGFAALGMADQGDDLVIVHDGGTIVLDGLAGVTLAAGDFDFV